jgi:hypothetical protein
MGRENPGSAAEYLELRRQELAAEQEAKREEDDRRLFAEQYVAAGGDPVDAGKEWKKFKAEKAAETARQVDGATVEHSRRHIARSL